MKSINKECLVEDYQKKKIFTEVTILKKIRHVNVCWLFDTFETEKHIIFVMELCSGGDLLNYVRKRRKLNELQAKFVFKQILDGVYHCHAQGIIHRDVKLDNILLDSHGVIKLGDFGVSKLITPYEVMHE